MMSLSLRRRRRDERGALLIIALFIVTVVALVTGAVLTRGEGSLRATVKLRDVARTAYSADAAADVAINALRTGFNVGNGEPSPWFYRNVEGTGCFGFDGSGANTTERDELIIDNLVPKVGGETQTAMSAAVRCTPEDATGDQGTAVRITEDNKPGNAILTLSEGGENGLKFAANGAGASFRVGGGVWSNSNIVRSQSQGGSLTSTEYIRAATGCSPQSAMVAPPNMVDCDHPRDDDPEYDSEFEVAGVGVPALQTPPASCPNNGSVTLSPGYYNDVNKLNALTDTNTNCFIHFQPGRYYFDFHNEPGDVLYDQDIATQGDDDNEWKIGGRKTVVAGTLTSDQTVPGRCRNPIDDATADQGVQFVFGGTSSIDIDADGNNNTAVEICGSYFEDRPPIAIFGQWRGTASPTNLAGNSARVPSGTTAVTNFTNATATRLSAEDGSTASWTRNGSGPSSNQSGSITMTGFAPTTTLPKGTVLTGAKLRVRHRSTGAQNKITLTPTLGTATLTRTLDARSSLGVEEVDLAGLAGWGGLQKAVHDEGFSGASAKFDASLNRSQVSELDSVRLELTYYLPQFRAQSGDVAAVGGEDFLQAEGNATTFYVQGTTYTPKGKIELELNNIGESVFRFGVIARALDITETASFRYSGNVIDLPGNSPGFGKRTTLVRLEVYLCPGMTTGCTVAQGRLALNARVRIFDNSATPGPPNRQVTILNWNHPR